MTHLTLIPRQGARSIQRESDSVSAHPVDFASQSVTQRPLGAARTGSRTARSQALALDPGLQRAAEAARNVGKAIRNVTTVEITSTCNLFCEGCCYFHDDFEAAPEPADTKVWRAFFREQFESGMRYGVFHGAEPALKQDRLMAAAEYFSRGIIYTNGTMRIHNDIPFIRMVSIWGDAQTTTKTRGGGTYYKSLRNFENDERARYSIVVNAQNYTQIPRIAADLAAAGVIATFSYFSPSYGYMDKVKSDAPNDSDYFRWSTEDDNMMLSGEQFARTRDLIEDARARHPATIQQGRAYNDWLTAPGARFTMDEQGYGARCAVRPHSIHQLFGADLKPIPAKCALGETDCANCRSMPATLTSILNNSGLFAGSSEDFMFWVETALQAGRFFLRDDDAAVWGDKPAPPMGAWREHYGVTTPAP